MTSRNVAIFQVLAGIVVVIGLALSIVALSEVENPGIATLMSAVVTPIGTTLCVVGVILRVRLRRGRHTSIKAHPAH